MGTRSFAQIAPTNGEIAMNAYIYGYGGHSLVTPHAALKQLWWTDDRIDNKITRAFIISKLRGEERDFLDKSLAFGEGLTDDTYMEWILERAKRFFLILSAVGVPDQIFGCIDDSWDDDDLPIPLDSVRNLELSAQNDDALNQKFYETQFIYLLRELKQGAHIDYGPNEHIPMEHVHSLPPAVMLQAWDRIHFPGKEARIFMRRRFSLTDKETNISHRDEFTHDTQQAQTCEHEHIAPCWATYTSKDAGYVLSDFVGEHTLGTFIDHRTPASLMRLPERERPILLLEWLHCLADAVAMLHHRGIAHSAIRPSNIIIDDDNRIAFTDIGSLRTFQQGKQPKKNEVYDYAAPETSMGKSVPITLAANSPPSSLWTFDKLRKFSTTSSSTSTSNGSTIGSNRTSAFTNSSSFKSPPSSIRKSAASSRNFSRHISPPSLPTTPSSPTAAFPKATLPDPESLCDLPVATPQMSDIWSLACIYLDLLTFIMKGRTTDFYKFRSTPSLFFSVSGKSKKRTDTSFHADPDKLDAWITILKDDSDAKPDRIYRGIPELLRLTRRMLSQNAQLRPSAVEVRDTIADILLNESGVDTLCCAGREWSEPQPAPPPATSSSSHSQQQQHQHRARDSISFATSADTAAVPAQLNPA
ncbi:hypothetical protein K431DRAFT_320533 [Polychaeton citri CBS 116435]|uniref:Protein kinase domain-containing protein n=1 Tax=Polychaeton citri CBS 116435 TaxID=1314669 RepID=A0A9P4UQQ0_9PEZI|nr:hypothetical protein K431DRAFT_320533 [Polychaeton citri CBS 116435]